MKFIAKFFLIWQDPEKYCYYRDSQEITLVFDLLFPKTAKNNVLAGTESRSTW